MKHFAAGAMIALFAFCMPLASLADGVDVGALPEFKRSRLQLYLTPREAYDTISKNPHAHSFLMCALAPKRCTWAWPRWQTPSFLTWNTRS